MKKWVLVSLAIVVVLSAGLYYYFSSDNSIPKITVTEGKIENGGTILEIKEETMPNVEEDFPIDMSENSIQHAIHGMSHQKVIAEDKWGMILLTKERIERLITVVQQNEVDYKNSSMYLSILNRWINNDFSQVDQDHNDIWLLQKGTIGKATGILSVEDEIEFIKKNFSIEE